jgi:hypothetical protein
VAMIHHLIKDDFSNRTCPYCFVDLNGDTESVWESELHYKEIDCQCGKRVRMKVDFAGSGHDNFDVIRREVEGAAR